MMRLSSIVSRKGPALEEGAYYYKDSPKGKAGCSGQMKKL